MLGAIFGDISGSIYEFNNINSEGKVILFNDKSFVTDDSIMTLAIAKALMNTDLKDDEAVKKSFVKWMVEIGKNYPDCKYGNLFYQWIFSSGHEAYNSFGNGSAMRVSAIPYISCSLEECLRLARLSAIVSHNHKEGIKGAEVVAGAIYLAIKGKGKDDIAQFAQRYYDLDDKKYSSIRSTSFDITCQGSVPKALILFLESPDFISSIRMAIASGGDSDTIAAITGGISGAFYRVSKEVEAFVIKKLDGRLLSILEDFKKYTKDMNYEN